MHRVDQLLRRAPELVPVSDSPRLDVELLLAWALNKDRTWLYTWPETELTPAQLAEFEPAFSRRLNGEPLAHIIGQREFWSLPLQVNSSTLIPRPDTERLVELALGLSESKPEGNALDLGTGTGAIALAFASERPGWRVVAVDASPEAVQLAERNRTQLGFDHVTCIQSDWFERVSGVFDLILSNPPYIADNDPHLNQGDVRFEPRSALVAENDGLGEFHRIVQAAPEYLTAEGWLLLEHGWTQGEAVRSIFEARGFQKVRTEQDLGGNDRVTLGQAPTRGG
ncbi:peptide chain release factor N(5)-glutamine methyltransferase [Marinimicrobium agarilyticum]|uniref:peptide chain release factor N(5)-glutamine methyltransferase n=1 Tax=Marinimicrobium agarilyticum TaxID=306546 RepID=UPI000409BBD1|nr:peptide chain release factor N(5)-glutamine methyltransferase [Marinimicrobium agarilyticum]